MIEPAASIVEPEEERADFLAAGAVTEAADHAVCGAVLLHLHHRAFAGDIRSVAQLGHHAVKRSAALLEPALGFGAA